MTDHMALAGVTVLVTRAAEKAGGLAEALRARGAEALVAPLIAHAPPAEPAALADALARLAAGAYDWLVFTSRTAVEVVAAGLPAPLPAACQLAAVGTATAEACRALLGRAPAAVPEQFIAEGLADALGEMDGARVLLPNADIARPTLEERLRAAGARVERVVAYRTVAAAADGPDLAGLLAAGRIDAITFTSGSTARAFAERVGPAGLEHARRTVVACIGPSTAAACRALGLEPAVIAPVSTAEGLADALAEHVAARLARRW